MEVICVSRHMCIIPKQACPEITNALKPLEFVAKICY